MNIYGQTHAQLVHYFSQLGENPAKASLLYNALYRQNITALSECSTMKASLTQQLMADFELTLPTLVEQQTSAEATKFLFSLPDGSIIETVLMHQKYGNSLCISSQVGCNMGCTFCQSGRFKKIRNLNTWEMTAQLLAVQQTLALKISNVVLMGIGEPFDNYDNVMAFIDIISHQKGLAIGMRHISVSTCGIVPGINDYCQRPSTGLLAVSLHAPNDGLRNQLMPINRRYPLDMLMTAINNYIATTNKKVMLEYCLLNGINDRVHHAEQLAALIGTSNCHVNLIPYNDTQNLGFTKSTPEQTRIFYHVLKKNHITVTMRREFGASVDAACGQLRANYQQKNHE